MPQLIALGSGRIGAATLVAMLLTASCGGSDGSSEPAGTSTDAVEADGQVATSPPTASAAPSIEPGGAEAVTVIETIPEARADEVSAVTERIPIGEIVQYAGFEIEVVEVLIGFDPVGFRFAEAHLGLTNRTATAAQLDSSMELVSGGSVAPLFRDGTPEIEPGATGVGTAGFRLGDDFDSSVALLVIGRSDLNRVQVPLGAVGELVARTPVDLAVAASANDDTSSVLVNSMVLSWDSTDRRAQSVPGEVFVRIEYSLDSIVATALNDDVIRLRLPSGGTIAPAAASTERIDAGVPATELFATFVVDESDATDLVAGVVPPGFVLVYSERFGNGVVEVPLASG